MALTHELPEIRNGGAAPLRGAERSDNAAGSAAPRHVDRAAAGPSYPLSDFAVEKPGLRYIGNLLAMRAIGRVAVGLNRLLGSRSRGRMGIITYHRVAPAVPGLPLPSHNVAPDRFRSHVAGLLKRGFSIWPLGKLLECNARGKLAPPKTIAITFDDGFQSVYSEAWPVLREFNAPATVFLATGYLGAAAPFPFDLWGLAHAAAAPPAAYRPLTLDQCREMRAGGLIEFGAHTHTHRDLRGRSECFREDLQTSVDILRDRFALDEVTFAFPYGSRRLGFAGAELVAAARQTGVSCGLTTESSLIEAGSDPFEWGRFNAFSWDTAATLAAKLDGWYTWAVRLRQRFRRRSIQSKRDSVRNMRISAEPFAADSRGQLP